LEQSKNLSKTINEGINSLERRKKRAKDTVDLFTDVIELRGSVKMVKKSLSNMDMENLETASYFIQKSTSLI
jgi:hypothetical protein